MLSKPRRRWRTQWHHRRRKKVCWRAKEGWRRADDAFSIRCTPSTFGSRCRRGWSVAGHRRQVATRDCTTERRAHSFHSDGRRRRRSGSPTQEVEGRPTDSIGSHGKRCFQPSVKATDRGNPCQDGHIRMVWSPCSSSGKGVTPRAPTSALEGIGARQEHVAQISDVDR